MPTLRWGRVMTMALAAACVWIAAGTPGCSRSKPPTQTGFAARPAPAPAPKAASAEPAKKPADTAPAQAEPAEARPAAEQPASPAMDKEPAAPAAESKAAVPADVAPKSPGAAKSAEPAAAVPPEPPPPPADWKADFKNWPKATGYLISRAHGYRMVVMHASTPQAADVFRNNAQHARHLEERGYQGFPAGSALAMETWELNPDGGPGAAGPVFFMRKEAAGFEPQIGDWSFVMTRSNLDVIAEGKDTHLTACKTCHASAKGTDFVPPVDR